jgi:hypothetical protein
MYGQNGQVSKPACTLHNLLRQRVFTLRSSKCISNIFQPDMESTSKEASRKLTAKTNTASVAMLTDEAFTVAAQSHPAEPTKVDVVGRAGCQVETASSGSHFTGTGLQQQMQAQWKSVLRSWHFRWQQDATAVNLLWCKPQA